MKVEIWSDVVCPWCYIGKRRFERALTSCDRADDVEVQWRSFQLNPAAAAGVRTTHDASTLAARSWVPASIRSTTSTPASSTSPPPRGLDYHFETYKVISTFDAHRVAHLAQAQGLDDAVRSASFAHCSLRARCSIDPDTLARLGHG